VPKPSSKVLYKASSVDLDVGTLEDQMRADITAGYRSEAKARGRTFDPDEPETAARIELDVTMMMDDMGYLDPEE
jgi:hypothetical protein